MTGMGFIVDLTALVICDQNKTNDSTAKPIHIKCNLT